jgi:ribosomal protein L40E
MTFVWHTSYVVRELSFLLKRKIFSILFALVLVTSLALTIAVPVLAAPTATFSPTSGPVGTKVTVSGTGWAASEAISSVTIGLGTYNGVPATYSATYHLTVDASGNLSGTITIPNVASGAQDIRITGATSGLQTFTGAFTVTAPTATFSLTSGPAILAIAIVLLFFILLIVLFMSRARRRAQRVMPRAAPPSPIPPAEQRVTPPATQPSSAPPAGLTCPRCQAKLPANARFCTHCGTRLSTPLVCPSCGAQVPEGAKFCSQCGTTIQGRYG